MKSDQGTSSLIVERHGLYPRFGAEVPVGISAVDSKRINAIYDVATSYVFFIRIYLRFMITILSYKRTFILRSSFIQKSARVLTLIQASRMLVKISQSKYPRIHVSRSELSPYEDGLYALLLLCQSLAPACVEHKDLRFFLAK